MKNSIIDKKIKHNLSRPTNVYMHYFKAPPILWITHLKLKQALPDRVGVGYSTVVQHGEAPYTPTQQAPCHVAAEGARAKEKTLGLGNGVQIK